MNWTLALKFSIGKKKRMRDCRILMAHDCIMYLLYIEYKLFNKFFLLLLLYLYNYTYIILYNCKNTISTYNICTIYKHYWGGGVQPHFCPWKNVCFPIFSHGEKWEKSIWKEREMNTFPSLSIYFFSIFPMGKNGKTYIFPWAKMGLDPPIIT